MISGTLETDLLESRQVENVSVAIKTLDLSTRLLPPLVLKISQLNSHHFVNDSSLTVYFNMVQYYDMFIVLSRATSVKVTWRFSHSSLNQHYSTLRLFLAR